MKAVSGRVEGGSGYGPLRLDASPKISDIRSLEARHRDEKLSLGGHFSNPTSAHDHLTRVAMRSGDDHGSIP